MFESIDVFDNLCKYIVYFDLLAVSVTNRNTRSLCAKSYQYQSKEVSFHSKIVFQTKMHIQKKYERCMFLTPSFIPQMFYYYEEQLFENHCMELPEDVELLSMVKNMNKSLKKIRRACSVYNKLIHILSRFENRYSHFIRYKQKLYFGNLQKQISENMMQFQ